MRKQQPSVFSSSWGTSNLTFEFSVDPSSDRRNYSAEDLLHMLPLPNNVLELVMENSLSDSESDLGSPMDTSPPSAPQQMPCNYAAPFVNGYADWKQSHSPIFSHSGASGFDNGTTSLDVHCNYLHPVGIPPMQHPSIMSDDGVGDLFCTNGITHCDI